MNGLQPNFFIIGAPKCGTTSMSVYLSSHPDIIISNPKEPHYFSKDINNGGIRKMQEYLDCFSSVDKKANAIGEASTLYLYSKVAVPNILAFNKDVRFIVMLRNPKEVAYSYHQLALKMFGETETNFETAWDYLDDRQEGKHVPAGCPDNKLICYGNIAKFGEQIEQLLSIVDHKKVHFIIFEDLDKNPKKEFQSVLEFLNLDSYYQTNFVIHNPTQTIKNLFVTKMINKAFGMKKALGITKQFGIANKIHSSNIKQGKHKLLDNQLLIKMNEFFHDDIQLLSTLLDKDFTHWLKN